MEAMKGLSRRQAELGLSGTSFRQQHRSGRILPRPAEFGRRWLGWAIGGRRIGRLSRGRGPNAKMIPHHASGLDPIGDLDGALAKVLGGDRPVQMDHSFLRNHLKVQGIEVLIAFQSAPNPQGQLPVSDPLGLCGSGARRCGQLRPQSGQFGPPSARSIPGQSGRRLEKCQQ
jgi:hypothetical protein